jgi:hypothetical protein
MGSNGKYKLLSTPRLKQNSTFKHENGEILNVQTSAETSMRRHSMRSGLCTLSKNENFSVIISVLK